MPRKGRGAICFTNGNVTEYVYSASGQKLRVKHYTAVPNINRMVGVQPPELTQAQILHTDYTSYSLGGRVIMKGSKWDKILFDGGYCQATQAGSSSDSFAFYYYNHDHLGNIREVVDASGTVQQVTNYYPFGTPYCDSPSAQSPDLQPYKYNGKELDRMHGLDTYDYGARQYDPVLCRWGRMDPLSEKYYGVSPYAYCTGNPVNRIDPNGEETGLPEELLFGLRHPIITIRVGIGVTKGADNISTNATRFATRDEILYGSAKRQDDRGSENGAFRHTLWQAEITSEFGSDIAKEIGDAHEDDPNIDLNQVSFNNIDEADKAADLHNNIIGRSIGGKNKGAGMKAMAISVLNEFNSNGLYVAKESKGGYRLEKVKLDPNKYYQLLNIFIQLDNNGRYDFEKKQPKSDFLFRMEALQNALP